MYGAVTALDQRQRFGQYFDFFWRAKRPSDLTVRFEYKQERLRAFVQAKEQAYQNVHGTNHSGFRVVGDEYFDDGQVLAWRCLLDRTRPDRSRETLFLYGTSPCLTARARVRHNSSYRSTCAIVDSGRGKWSGRLGPGGGQRQFSEQRKFQGVCPRNDRPRLSRIRGRSCRLRHDGFHLHGDNGGTWPCV